MRQTLQQITPDVAASNSTLAAVEMFVPIVYILTVYAINHSHFDNMFEVSAFVIRKRKMVFEGYLAC